MGTALLPFYHRFDRSRTNGCIADGLPISRHRLLYHIFSRSVSHDNEYPPSDMLPFRITENDLYSAILQAATSNPSASSGCSAIIRSTSSAVNPKRLSITVKYSRLVVIAIFVRALKGLYYKPLIYYASAFCVTSRMNTSFLPVNTG